MGETVSSYWWIIIPLFVAVIALFFSFEKRSSRDKKAFPRDYIDGLKAIIAGDDNNAFVKLKQTVANDTNNIDAYLKLGDLFRKRGQFEKAIQIHRELLIRKNLKQEVISDIQKSLVEDYIQANKFDSALEALEKLVKDSSYKLWALEKMLEVYEKTKQWDKALNVRKSLLKSKNQHHKLAVYKHLIGQDLYDRGEFHKARLAFKDAINFKETFAPSYIMIAESYLAENRKEDAVEFFKKLTKNVPSEVYPIIHKMEEALFELGHFSDVEDIYKDILEVCPEDTDIIKALAGISEKKGDLKGAIDILNTVLNRENQDIAAIARLAELYLSNDQKEKALQALAAIQVNWPTREHQYSCPHCQNILSNQEIVCPNCNRVGPYKRL